MSSRPKALYTVESYTYMVMNKKLEMWKTEKLIGLFSCIFDTSFLAFIWIMQWKVFFWFYVVISLLSIIGNAVKVVKLEKELQ